MNEILKIENFLINKFNLYPVSSIRNLRHRLMLPKDAAHENRVEANHQESRNSPSDGSETAVLSVHL